MALVWGLIAGAASLSLTWLSCSFLRAAGDQVHRISSLSVALEALPDVSPASLPSSVLPGPSHLLQIHPFLAASGTPSQIPAA